MGRCGDEEIQAGSFQGSLFPTPAAGAMAQPAGGVAASAFTKHAELKFPVVTCPPVRIHQMFVCVIGSPAFS